MCGGPPMDWDTHQNCSEICTLLKALDADKSNRYALTSTFIDLDGWYYHPCFEWYEEKETWVYWTVFVENINEHFIQIQ